MRSLALIVSLLCCVAVMSAGDPSFITKNSEGREFWLCFMKNFREAGQKDVQNRQETLRLQLFLTSSFDAVVRIQIEEILYDNTVTIKANTVVNVQIPARAQLRGIEVGERLAVHVTADTAISVYGLNSRFQTTDTFLGLPVSVLGTEYRAVGYTKLASDLLSAVSVVITEDETDLTITPTVTTSTGRPAGRPFTTRLRKGDVYTIGARWESIGTCDLTGTLITANKKIAVFSGHNCAYVPPKIEACNHLVEQLPPVTAWGKHYYLGMLKERSKFTYRVISSQDGTRVFEDAKLVAVLRAGEFFENLNLSRHVQVTADKPVLVAQFAQGFKNGDSVGDPMMILVSPTQQFLREYRIATPISGAWHHYINVVTPTTAIDEIRINGRRIDSLLFVVLGESRYSIAQVPIPFGSHVIKSDTPFGLYSYGFGYGSDAYDAYGNMAGQSFFELNKLVDSLPPEADGKNLRDDYVVTIRDDRPMDKGVKSVKVLVSSGLDAQIPKIEEGAPQVAIRVKQTVGGHAGRLVFRTEDVAGNVSSFTLCYVFDSRSERYTYQLSEGTDVICASEGAWMVGAYMSLGSTFHNVDMRLPELSTAQLPFSNQFQGTSFGGGLLIGRRMSQDVILAGRLGMSSLGGRLLSPDSTVSSVFDTASKSFVPYQEGTTLCVTAPYINAAAGIEWFPQRYFYISAGIQISLPIGSSVTVQRVILRPSNWVFAQGSTPQTVLPESLSALTSVQLGLYGGLGFSYPVSFRVSVFAEALYSTWFGNVATPGPWSVERIGANIGARYRW
ncbi:MAG: IgGFc-binding protein [Candidatus Kapabacteria bacterium]|nr:IgGFc-binding protein [Candidatus Kapabacteria bacterium]